MATVSFLSLGLFVGLVISFALLHITDWTNWAAVLSGAFSAAAAGAIFVFLELADLGKSGSSNNAKYAYPMGLLLALLWVFIHYAHKHKTMYFIGGSTATLIVLAILFVPSVRRRLSD